MAIVPWGAKPGTSGGGGAVSSVSNSDGTLTISPTTGAVVALIPSTSILPSGVAATTQSAGDNSTKLATDAFVTTAVANGIAGVNPAQAVQAATTTAGNTSGFTYNNGASGIGATFTGSVNTAVVIDGYTFTALGQRLLVKNDTQSPSGAFNGIYYVTQVQTSLLAPILTRALDYNQPSDINNAGAIPVINGTVNGSSQWVQTANIVTVGTTPLVFAQFTPPYAQIMTTPTYDPAGIAQQIVGVSAIQTITGVKTMNLVIDANNAVSVTSNAGTCSASYRLNTFTNSSAATMAITLATSGAADGQLMIVRVYDFSAVTETIGWTNTENSLATVPTTSNGSTTLPLTVGFQYNGQTSKWRCIASA